MLFSKFDITRRGASTIGEFKRRGRRGKKYCNYARFHVCLQFYATKDVEDAKSANREDAPERSMISIGFSAVL